MSAFASSRRSLPRSRPSEEPRPSSGSHPLIEKPRMKRPAHSITVVEIAVCDDDEDLVFRDARAKWFVDAGPLGSSSVLSKTPSPLFVRQASSKVRYRIERLP
jgi:hypothetical protein